MAVAPPPQRADGPCRCCRGSEPFTRLSSHAREGRAAPRHPPEREREIVGGGPLSPFISRHRHAREAPALGRTQPTSACSVAPSRLHGGHLPVRAHFARSPPRSVKPRSLR